MLICQEYYYHTRGSYRYRKWMKHFYQVSPNGMVQLVHVARESGQEPTAPYVLLPAVEVTPRQFKELETRKSI